MSRTSLLPQKLVTRLHAWGHCAAPPSPGSLLWDGKRCVSPTRNGVYGAAALDGNSFLGQVILNRERQRTAV